MDVDNEEGKKILILMRGEKKAFARFKDIIRKYRMLLPFILGRSDRLEKKISKLMSNSEASEKASMKLKNQILNAQSKQAGWEKRLLETKVKQKGIQAQYATLLEGKLPKVETDISEEKTLKEMEKDKERFFSNIQDRFNSLEKKMKALEKRRAVIEDKKNMVDKQIDKMYKKTKMIDTKITFYQEDIQKQLMELHNQLQNERKLTREYNQIIEIMEGAPGLSEWSMSLMKEAIQLKFPKANIIKLEKTEDSSLPMQ